MFITVMPSPKGQITIPTALRKKYNITENTPIVIEDTGEGLVLKIKEMIDQSGVEYYEDKKGFGLKFKKGISSKVLLKAIKQYNEQNK